MGVEELDVEKNNVISVENLIAVSDARQYEHIVAKVKEQAEKGGMFVQISFPVSENVQNLLRSQNLIVDAKSSGSTEVHWGVNASKKKLKKKERRAREDCINYTLIPSCGIGGLLLGFVLGILFIVYII